MYESNAFDTKEMMNWENQPITTKTNFTLTKDYFKKTRLIVQHIRTKRRHSRQELIQ